MNRILLFLWGIFLSGYGLSQNGLFINDVAGGLRIKQNGFLYIEGDLQMLNANPSPTLKMINGQVYLTGDLVANDTLYFEKQDSLPATKPAQIHFVGNVDSHVSGNNRLQLCQLFVNKSSGNVYFDHTADILDTIQFIQGNAIIDTGITLELAYRRGTLNVPTRPYILGESAQHRFTGDGFLHARFPIAANHATTVANTGFYFHGHQSDTLDLVRGHKKQLYAANGSIDRYFDVQFTGLTAAFHDTVAIRYLPDVDYSAFGVDTNRLGIFVSPQLQDVDFRRVYGDHVTYQDSASITDGSQFALPTVNVSPTFYRFTLADTICSSPPASTLPDTLLHICANDSVLVEAINVSNPFPITVFWEDGSQNPNRYISSLATQQEITLQLIDSRGCITRDTVFVDATAPDPVAIFTKDDACLGDSVFVHNGSTIISGTFTSSWAFGNNTYSTSSDSTQGIYYISPGAYTVNLALTSNYGCTDDTTRIVDLFDLPAAAFTLTEDCFNQVYAIDGSASTGTTIPNPYAITSYVWLLDNNPLAQTTSTFLLPPPSGGPHSLSLIVETGVQCRDTVHQLFTVYDRDTVAFTVNNACAGQPIGLTNTSIVHNANPNYLWSFSDGTTSTDVTPLKQFALPGTYGIQLILSTDANCSDTTFGVVTVYGVPVSTFTVANLCEQIQLSPIPDSIDANLTYAWDFGDGFTSSAILPQHAYTTAGNYSVSLILTTAQGCSSQSTQSITVYPSPNAAFSNTTVCLGAPTQFTSNAAGSGLSYQWNFGDLSNSVTVQDPQYTYATAGNFTTTFTVNDVNGCSASVGQTVTVNALPSLTLGTISTCGSSYPLNALNPGSSYLWSPGNETTQTIVAAQSGNYSVTVTAPNGCMTTANAVITLNSVTMPNLGPDTAVCGSILLDANYPGSTYIWSGGGNNQTLLATSAGIYWVEVTDPNGCIGSDTVIVQAVYPVADPNLGVDFTACSGGAPITLNPGSFVSYDWNTGSTDPMIIVSQTGIYVVEVIDNNSCVAQDTIAVNFNATPTVELPASVTACDQITLTASFDPGYQFLWNDGNQSQIRSVAANGTYSVIVTNPVGGCVAYDTSIVTINVTPVIDLGADTVVCSNTPLLMDASGFAGATYTWTSTSGATVGTSATYTPPSSDTYLVSVNQQGCVGSDAIIVTLLPAPFIEEHPLVYYICGTTPVTLNGSLFGTNSWTSTNGFSSTDNSIEVYESGNYYLVSQVAGCTANDVFTLEISPNQIQAFYLVDNDTTKDNALQFIDLSEPTPLTYLWDFGDGSYDTIANPIHEYSVVDTFYTSLTISNGICISRYEKAVNSKDFVDSVFNPAAALDFVDVQLYPNPANEHATLAIQLSDKASIRVQLCDALGNILQTDEIFNEYGILIDYQVTHLATGVYFVRIEAESLKGKISDTRKLLTSNY
jgi:PKD repeat protein